MAVAPKYCRISLLVGEYCGPMKRLENERMVASIASLGLMGLLFWLSSLPDLAFFQEAPLPDWI